MKANIQSKKASTGLKLIAITAGLMVMLASCGGHKLCGAYGGKTNTNSEHMAE